VVQGGQALVCLERRVLVSPDPEPKQVSIHIIRSTAMSASFPLARHRSRCSQVPTASCVVDGQLPSCTTLQIVGENLCDPDLRAGTACSTSPPATAMPRLRPPAAGAR
jgi:hypothetical protein